MLSSNKQTPKSSETLFDHLVTPGIILFTERFSECVEFYRDKLGLPFWFGKEGLCCLRFGSGYLMVESGGSGKSSRKTVQENPTCLRFNVPDVIAAANLLALQNIDVTINRYDWGTTGSFLDPDGNVCSLKNADDSDFEKT